MNLLVKGSLVNIGLRSGILRRSIKRCFKMEALNNQNIEDSKKRQALQKNNQPLKKRSKLKRYKAKKVDPTSPLGVLQFEIDELLRENNLEKSQVENDVTAILNDTSFVTGPIASKYHREVSDVKVLKLGSNGDGLAIISNPVETDKKTSSYCSVWASW